jgi:hypothetical protein
MMMEQHDNIKKLRDLVDATADKIVRGDLSVEEAEALVKETRQKAEMLIADDMDKYDLIYEARFRRLIDQFIKQKQVAG